jgi:hypothetical protein
MICALAARHNAMPCELWVKPKSEAVSFFAKCLHLGDIFFRTAPEKEKMEKMF